MGSILSNLLQTLNLIHQSIPCTWTYLKGPRHIYRDKRPTCVLSGPSLFFLVLSFFLFSFSFFFSFPFSFPFFSSLLHHLATAKTEPILPAAERNMDRGPRVRPLLSALVHPAPAAADAWRLELSQQELVVLHARPALGQLPVGQTSCSVVKAEIGFRG